MAGAGLAFQECLGSSPTMTPRMAISSCLMLFRTLQLPAMGLYHCEDAAQSA